MTEEMEPQRYADVVLSQTLVDIRQDIREFRGMMTDVTKNMVFKEDFNRLVDRVAQLESNRLPSWVIPVAAVIVSVVAIVVGHFWK